MYNVYTHKRMYIVNLNLSKHQSKLNKHNEMKNCTNLFKIIQELDVVEGLQSTEFSI